MTDIGNKKISADHGRNKVQVIYILGTSFSGSTLLGSMIGANAQVWNLGEVKQLPRLESRDKKCTCGHAMKNCSFWGEIDFSKFSIKTKANFSDHCKVLIPFGRGRGSETNSSGELAFFQDMYQRSGRPMYMIDVSKSLWRLDALLDQKDIVVKVLYLFRSVEGTTSSFKRRYSFWRGLFTWKMFHGIAPRYLKRRMNSKDFLRVSYDRLASETDEVMTELGDFLGLNLSEWKSEITDREVHISTGNVRRREVGKAFEIRPDDSWKNRLTSLEKKMCKWIS